MKALQSLSFLLVASSLILLNACAKPNYEEAGRNPAVDEQGTCDIYLSQAGACIDLIWEKKPTNEDMGSFVLEIFNPKNRDEFVDFAATLEVVLWMPSMGHGSSPVKVERIAFGQYRVSNVFFIMRGDWEVQLKLKNGNILIEQATLPYHY